jgi:SpoVK/Ycf46/Vps4 family AAA+-type ATPase
MTALQLKKNLAKKLNRPEVENMEFSTYEMSIATDVISPQDLQTKFEDIGGMEEQLEDIENNIVIPIQMWSMFRNQTNILPCPTGVLLYGLPGTGKTLTAKAVAKEANATFIGLKASSIMDKWFGESDKLVSALFNLAHKLGPSIIFIDEIDTLLSNRGTAAQLSPAMHSMQGLFLSEWDGLSSNKLEAPVIVLGATNRPNDLDKAFLRRMPFQIEVKVPTQEGRLDILTKMLKNENIDEDVDLKSIAGRTVNFTGANLSELVRVANQPRIKETFEYNRNAYEAVKFNTSLQSKEMNIPNMRSINQADFDYAIKKIDVCTKSRSTFVPHGVRAKDSSDNIIEQYLEKFVNMNLHSRSSNASETTSEHERTSMSSND